MWQKRPGQAKPLTPRTRKRKLREARKRAEEERRKREEEARLAELLRLEQEREEEERRRREEVTPSVWAAHGLYLSTFFVRESEGP